MVEPIIKHYKMDSTDPFDLQSSRKLVMLSLAEAKAVWTGRKSGSGGIDSAAASMGSMHSIIDKQGKHLQWQFALSTHTLEASSHRGA